MDEKQNQTIENEEKAQEQAGEEEAQKQAEETSEQEQAEETILSEIAEYKAKIEALDVKIAEFEAKKVDDKKRALMRKWNYTDEQIERYIGHIKGDTAEEIEKEIIDLMNDIPPKRDNYADPSPMNGAKYKPAAADPGEVGKKLFERIKNKIWGGGTTL